MAKTRRPFAAAAHFPQQAMAEAKAEEMAG